MSYDAEEQTRQIYLSSKQAIALAMDGRWREAVAANKGIIEHYPNDIDAFNRLGRAHMELGEYTLAHQAYSRSKEIDPYNSIADKNLHRLANLEGSGAVSPGSSQRVEPRVFIEEIGKAGIVSLQQLADKKVLAEADAGDKVNLKIEDAGLVIEDSRRRRLGQIESKHSQRLVRLMQGGNVYTATVISSSDNMLAVIIREVYQHPSQEGQLSFPSKGLGSFRSYISDKILRQQIEFDETTVKPAYIDTGEDDTEILSDDSIDEGDEEASQEV